MWYTWEYAKEELVVLTDKRFWTVINKIQLYYQGTKSKAIIEQFCMHCYVVLSNIMEFLLFVFISVSLHHM